MAETLLFKVTLIFAVPTFLPVIFPLEVTEAILGLLLFHDLMESPFAMEVTFTAVVDFFTCNGMDFTFSLIFAFSFLISCFSAALHLLQVLVFVPYFNAVGALVCFHAPKEWPVAGIGSVLVPAWQTLHFQYSSVP